MRDPKRIGRILDLLRVYWTQYPDLRLGQILGNAVPSVENFNLSGQKSYSPGNIYSYDDAKFEEWLRKQVGPLGELAIEAPSVEPRRGEL